MTDHSHRPDARPPQDQTAQWTHGQLHGGTSGATDELRGWGGGDGAGSGFGADPWTDYPSVEHPPAPSSGPNWTLIAAAGVIAAALVAGAVLVSRSGTEDDVGSTEPTLPLEDRAPEATQLPTEGRSPENDSVSSVIVTQTSEPVACFGPIGADQSVAEGGPLGLFLNAVLSQQGTAYEFGAEVEAGEDDPQAFDSSELVQWAATRAGVAMRDGSWIQYLELDRCGSSTSVDEALGIPGALIFGFPTDPVEDGPRPPGSFVVISLGDGRIVDIAPPEIVIRAVADLPDGRMLTHGAQIPDLGLGTVEFVPG